MWRGIFKPFKYIWFLFLRLFAGYDPEFIRRKSDQELMDYYFPTLESRFIKTGPSEQSSLDNLLFVTKVERDSTIWCSHAITWRDSPEFIHFSTTYRYLLPIRIKLGWRYASGCGNEIIDLNRTCPIDWEAIHHDCVLKQDYIEASLDNYHSKEFAKALLKIMNRNQQRNT